MRIMTVRQPWAWAIIHGGKDVENRTRNLAGDYRGPVAIHAGLTEDKAGYSPQMDALWAEHHERTPYPPAFPTTRRDQSIYLEFGAIIGVVDLVGVHPADDTGLTGSRPGLWPTCSVWAERRGHHLVLANPRPLSTPIPYRGALHLQTPTAAETAEILRRVK